MSDVVTAARPPLDDGVSDVAQRESAELGGAVALRPARSARGATGNGSDIQLRKRLEKLRQATSDEVERRRNAAALEPADGLPVPVKELSSISREVPRLVADLPRAAVAAAAALRDTSLRDTLRAVAGFVSTQRELSAAARRGDRQPDDFGFDREWTESLLPIFRFLYRHWWRVETIGMENVPGTGRALLTSNHAGVLPYDGAMIRVGIFDEHPQPRHARALILNGLFAIPLGSWFMRRTGNTLAHPNDAERLLEDDELVLVFPEGAKGPGKLYSERYRLRRFGRGGFVQIALRTGSPIIPVSVVGSEELHPMLANITPLANALGLPYVPVTATFPLLGPLGAVPLPSSWIIEFHEPIPVDKYGPDAANDASLVMHLADQVRDTIQAGLYTNLQRRGSVFA
jgi:1-acyl-sn-glycerol-3-phosphate acyltransferase